MARESLTKEASYADPNATGPKGTNHHGGVYKAASWTALGQCEETRAYVLPDGCTVARRSFHSGRKQLSKAEIKATGAVESRLPGKLRFGKGLTRKARQLIVAKAAQ